MAPIEGHGLLHATFRVFSTSGVPRTPVAYKIISPLLHIFLFDAVSYSAPYCPSQCTLYPLAAGWLPGNAVLQAPPSIPKVIILLLGSDLTLCTVFEPCRLGPHLLSSHALVLPRSFRSLLVLQTSRTRLTPSASLPAVQSLAVAIVVHRLVVVHRLAVAVLELRSAPSSLHCLATSRWFLPVHTSRRLPNLLGCSIHRWSVRRRFLQTRAAYLLFSVLSFRTCLFLRHTFNFASLLGPASPSFLFLCLCLALSGIEPGSGVRRAANKNP